MELDLQNPLTVREDLRYDGVSSLFSNEFDHAPRLFSSHSADLRLSIRRSVLSLISRAKLSYCIDPFLVYLSVNYVDRFLSKQQILEKKPWIANVLVLASLSLAAKMTNSDLSISLSHLQREEGFAFDAQSVCRMEKLMLATLQWRMRSITPFSFLRYFISLSVIDDSRLSRRLEHRASDIIFNIQQELKILDYKPSIVAASALLCSIQELTPLTFSSSKAAISSCEYVNKDALLECVGAMQEIARDNTSLLATASDTLTPISVLARQRTSSGGDEGASCPGFPERDDVKRRRLNGLCDNRTFRVVSQIQQC